MLQILTVVLGFILTGLVGNQLIQRWQHRNWLHQQHFIGAEKEYSALRELVTEISGLINKRLYKMRRLLWSISNPDPTKMDKSLQEYDVTITTWNESLNSFYVRLNFYLSYYDTTTLEKQIHERFQRAGGKLEQFVRQKRAGSPPSDAEVAALERSLTSLQVASVNFIRDLTREAEHKKNIVYFGRDVPFSRKNITHFSTWELIKGLFVRNIDSFSVRRPSSHFR